jgi:endonuclease III
MKMKKQWSMVFIGLLIAAALSAQTLDERIKDAVNGLVQVSRIDVVILPPVIQGTDAPSEFSRYLHQKIDTYAIISRRFNVIQPTRGGGGGAQVA